MERNCHLIDLHKVIMAVILTAIKNQKNLHTLLDKLDAANKALV